MEKFSNEGNISAFRSVVDNAAFKVDLKKAYRIYIIVIYKITSLVKMSISET